MYDLPVADIHAHMIHVTVARIKDQISRLCRINWYLHPVSGLILRNTRKRITKLRIYALHESGAVGAVCQTRTSPYVGVSDKLQGKIHHRFTGQCRLRCLLHRSDRIIAGLIILRLYEYLCEFHIILARFFHCGICL